MLTQKFCLSTKVGGRVFRAACVVAAAFALAACNGSKNAYAPPPPPKVAVAQPLQKPVTLYLNLTGNTSLVSLPALIKRADWVITNDSGPMHLAAAQGVRTLGIFGPTDPRLFGPYPLEAPTNFVIQAPVGDLKLLPAKDAYARFVKIRARLHKK